MNLKILEKMGFKPSSHNEIFLDHLETITDFLKEQCPIEKKKALAMLRGSTGISNRYVREHIESLLAWEIIKSHAGNYDWIFDQQKKPEIENIKKNKIIMMGIKNEDVPDSFPGNIGEYKPCNYRDKQNICRFNREKPFTPTSKKCEKCIARKEI